MARPAYRNTYRPGLEVCYGSTVVVQSCRERLIEATLSLCVERGYEATTIEQIAAAAGVTPVELSRYFATKNAVLMSIVEDLLTSTVAALGQVDQAATPEQALLLATTEVVTAIIDGYGVISRDRMLSLSQIVTAYPALRRQASSIRKRVLSQALADRLGVPAEGRRVRQAVTMWSAIATGAYVARSTMGAHYDPSQDAHLEQRVITELNASYTEVMGKAPHRSEGCD